MRMMPAAVLALSVLLAATTLTVSAGADTYVKTESHTDSYYRGGQVFPAEDSAREMWIGENRLAYVTEGQRIVVDLGAQTLIFVNRAESTYVETPLPLDLSQVFSEPENARLTLFKRRGTVEPGQDTRTVGTRACASYKLNDWMIYDDSKLSERDIVMWTTTDVPFDWKTVSKMQVALETIGNLGDDYIALRRGIEGFQLAADETTYTEGIAIPTAHTVTELEEREPPAGIYAAPEGFTKKDLLTLQDLRS